MRKTYRRWSIKRVSRAVTAGLIFVLISIAIYSCHEWMEYRSKYLQAEKKLNTWLKTVYVADTDLKKGTVLTKDHVRTELHYSDIDGVYMNEEWFGQRLLIDVARGTCLTDEMLGKLQEGVREVYVSEVMLSENINPGCRIDVRISYPNAEDYIVLADKVILLKSENDGMVLQLSEEEILFLSSATADCRFYNGTYLYAVRYPEGKQVMESEVSYLPGEEVQLVLGLQSEKGEERSALEERLLSGKNK